MRIDVHGDIYLRISEVTNSTIDIWFIHGFGGSGQIFQEAFLSPLITHNNIYVPDLPGFGATPALQNIMSIQAITVKLEDVINKLSANRHIAIVAHSLGGITGTLLCDRLKSQVKMYINVEGNLTEADAYFCGLAKDFNCATEFHNAYKKKVFAMLEHSEEALHRHYASIYFAQSEPLYLLGKSGALMTGETKSGAEFARLTCSKLYYWAERSTPQETKAFIKKSNLPNRLLTDCGHWPMIDKPNEFYQTVLNDIS